MHAYKIRGYRANCQSQTHNNRSGLRSKKVVLLVVREKASFVEIVKIC